MSAQKKLLVMDNDLENCEHIRLLAQNQHYAIQTLSNPLHFPDFYREFKPDLIMIDLEMPDIDGIELLRFLKNDHCSCPIILISALDEKIVSAAQHVGQLHGLNMATTLKKPINEEAFKLTLQKTERSIHLKDQELPQSVEHELILHYQPILSLKNNELIGAEVFVHWIKNTDNQFYLQDFATSTEKTEVVKQITLFTFETALKEVIPFYQNNPSFIISINLATQLLSDLHLPDELQALAKSYNFLPQNVCLEISESANMTHPSQVADILTRFRMKKFKLTLDNFGSGFSSTAALCHMPFNELKINKNFIKNLTQDDKTVSMVKNIITLGKKMGFKIAAEGVDKEQTFKLLKDFNCDIAQGSHIAPPMPINSFSEWLSKKGNQIRQ